MKIESFDTFKEWINTKAWANPVPTHIVECCYKIFFKDDSQWKIYFNEPLYVIGLSEDRYDYYYLCVDSNKKLKFITCVYNIDNYCKTEQKKWTKDELNSIFTIAKEYFKNHTTKENLIFLDGKLSSTKI